MKQESNIPQTANRRTVLKYLGAGAVGMGSFSVPASALRHSGRVATTKQDDILFADDFEDGDFAWTVVDRDDFWKEENGRAYYTPSSSEATDFAYANATFSGNQGELTWPLAIEVKAYASDTSANLGAWAKIGGPEDGVSSPVLAVQDTAFSGSGGIRVWNSEGNRFTVGSSRQNNTWYTYQLIPDLEAGQVELFRNNERFTFTEPNADRIGNISIALDGGTCLGCGGPGHRQYESIKVWNIEVDDDDDGDDDSDDDSDDG